MFGSFRQFGALAKVLDQKANRPIGGRIVLKYGLNKAYIDVNRHVMTYLLCALLHTTTHKKFPLNYATAAVSHYLFFVPTYFSTYWFLFCSEIKNIPITFSV